MNAQKDLGEWVANLNSRLEEIAAGYAAASPSDKRFVMVAVCGVLSIELRRLAGIEQLNLLPLEDLMLRLNDVTTGKNALAPIKRPKGGRPPDSFRDSIVQGRAVAAVEYLMSAGEREDDAIAFVAKQLSNAGLRGRRSSYIPVGTVRDWRTKIHYGDSDPLKADARAIYSQASENLENLGAESLKTLRERRKFMSLFLNLENSAVGKILINPPS